MVHAHCRQEGPEEPREGSDGLAAYGFGSKFRTLSICTTCLHLFDAPSPRQGDFEQQKCRCHPRGEPRWPGYDYNERTRLCDCCGRYVLRSGSRWSVWFCETCKERVCLLNEEFGFAVIPIGRHSLMNGFALRPGLTEEEVDARTERLFGRFQDMLARIDCLEDWKGEQLRQELERLGLITSGRDHPREVALATYLRAVAAEDRTSTVDRSLEAFRGLADRFEVREIIDPHVEV